MKPTPRERKEEDEALLEAKHRWGRDGMVQYHPAALTRLEKGKLAAEVGYDTADTANRENRTRLTSHRCMVGRFTRNMGLSFFSVKGAGDTWEEAWARADGTWTKERFRFDTPAKENA